MRVELWGDEIERISKINPLTGETIATLEKHGDLPGEALHHQAADARARGEADPRGAGRAARRSCATRASCSRRSGWRAHELRHRDDAGDRHVRRHRELLAPPRPAATAGERPACLLDYFPEDFLVVVDESHVTLPQIARDVQRRPRAQADARRLRLPPAERARQPAADVRRVPGAHAAGDVRVGDAGRARAAAVRGRRRRADHPPDGAASIRRSRSVRCAGRWTTCSTRSASASGAASACSSRRSRSACRRTSPTTCSRWACACATCTPTSTPSSAWRSCAGCGSASSTCWSGINLLREGLDMPEVSLVAILDADQEGFLRSDRSLIQTVGRAARHVERTRDLLRRPHHRLDAALHRGDGAPPRDPGRRTTSRTASRRTAW